MLAPGRLRTFEGLRSYIVNTQYGIKMRSKRKTWREKLHDAKGLPKIEVIPPDRKSTWGSGTMVVPAPVEVDAVMKRVPRGMVITTNEIRSAIARSHDVQICCPLTTGIFAWIAAHAAEEDRLEGRARYTPWWRTLKSGGVLNPKFPGGVEAQKDLLEAEGHMVAAKGKLWKVVDYEKKLLLK
jgi:hypothetical protein